MPPPRRRLVRRPFRALGLLALALAVPAAAAPAVAAADTVRVGAAISLKDALADIGKAYQADTGDTLEVSLGSSGQVMAQVKNGADLDVFVSAAVKQVDDLQKANLVDAATRRTVATNTLVLVVPAAPGNAAANAGGGKGGPADFEALADPAVGRVAAGEPRTVPAGQYAAQTFAALKLTDALAGRLVYGTNVRQVLAYVERGEVAAGVVYATDAKESGDKVRVVATAAAATHDPIVYPAAVVTASKRPAAARRFLDYLATSPKARAALAAKGFGLPDDPAAAAAATRPAAPAAPAAGVPSPSPSPSPAPAATPGAANRPAGT